MESKLAKNTMDVDVSGPFETVEIRYKPGSPELEKTAVGSWIDLYTYEDVVLPEGGSMIVDLGVAMRLPDGYEAIMAPRSSTFKRHGLLQTNGIGVIDHQFNGSTDWWGMPVYATRAVSIPKGTRLCQFRIQREQPDILFKPVEYLNSEDRGSFGSTGE